MNNGFLKPYPWLGGADGPEHRDLPLSAEEKWKATRAILQKLEHDWKYRERRRRMHGRKTVRRWRGGAKLGMKILNSFQ
jgi:hypothetical protein